MNNAVIDECKPGLQLGSGIYIKEEFNFHDIPEYVTDIKSEMLKADKSCNISSTVIKQEDSGLGSEYYSNTYNPSLNSDAHAKVKDDIKIEYAPDTKAEEWNRQHENSAHAYTFLNFGDTKEKPNFNNNVETRCTNEELSKDDNKDIAIAEDHADYQTPEDCTTTRNSPKKKIKKQKSKGKIKFYQCPDCVYKTKYKSGLNMHIKCRHKTLDEVEVFKCNFCAYHSADKFKVKRHLRIHQPEERHFINCPHCEYRTIHSSALKKHVILHKDINEIETYKCIDCDYRTIIRSRLNRHSLKHKKLSEDEMFNCPECSYKTALKGSLKTHLLRHKSITEVEMHKCPHCKYETRYKCAMNKHVLIHKKREMRPAMQNIKMDPLTYSFGRFPTNYFPAMGGIWRQEK